MTVTLSDQDTDTARQILEQLDDEPACDNPACDETAQWAMYWRNTYVCACEMVTLVCTRCRALLEQQYHEPIRRRWTCRTCGTEVPGLWTSTQICVLDRIEPLR